MRWSNDSVPAVQLQRAVLAVAVFVVSSRMVGGADPVEYFEQRIRPVLVEACYECHSSQADPPEGGLRLDSRPGVIRGGDGGPAVVPGQAEESLLIQALRYDDDAFQMPPSGKLPDNVIRDFTEWIDQGAIDPRSTEPESLSKKNTIDVSTGRDFWAFQRLREVEPPCVLDTAWTCDPLDRFVLSKLEENDLQPAPRASRRNLLRRLYFDLTGLPPHPADVAAFCEDDSATSWLRTVDRLLATRVFAEHWARKWLDVVRYADSNGNDFNATYHEAWRYRNFVIDSISQDARYDQFVRQQLAGDLMDWESDSQRAEQLIATGFMMFGPKMLSERDKEKLQLDVADEQLDTLGKALLGLTLGCARCHDHKFDPIPATDYYAMAGLFYSTVTLDGEIQEYVSDWTEVPLPTSLEHRAQIAQYEGSVNDLEQRIHVLEEQRRELRTEIERLALVHEGIVVDNGEAEVRGMWKHSTFEKQYVGKEYLHDENQGKGEKSVSFSATIPEQGEYEVRFAYTAGGNRAAHVPVSVRHVDGITEIVVDQTQVPEVNRQFVALGTFQLPAGTHEVVVVSNRDTTGYVVVDAIQLVPMNLRQAEGADLDEAEAAHRISRMRESLSSLQNQSRELKDQRKAWESCKPSALPMAMAVRESETPRDLAVRIRGVSTQLGPTVPRGFLRVLSQGDHCINSRESSGRLELADWTVSDAGPLLARVIVNRIWHHLIGAGIVRSCDNFGNLGDVPTHPQLLDSLAADFVQHNWSIKYVVRRIVLSNTYQMQVASNQAAERLDPENRLLWRGHRKRLTAEQLRDAMLSVGGAIDLRLANSPVSGLGKLVNNNSATETAFDSQETLRRSIYLPVVRNELPELMVAFDFADPDRVVGRRPETNVPAQALLLMNHPFVRKSAERTINSIAQFAAGPERVSELYQRLFQRVPQSAELSRDLTFIATVRAESSDELTAWIDLCHALMASTEFRYLD